MSLSAMSPSLYMGGRVNRPGKRSIEIIRETSNRTHQLAQFAGALWLFFFAPLLISGFSFAFFTGRFFFFSVTTVYLGSL